MPDLKSQNVARGQVARALLESAGYGPDQTDSESLQKLRSLARKLPSMLQTNGLPLTLVYLSSRQQEHKLIAACLGRHLFQTDSIQQILTQCLAQVDSPGRACWLTREALTLATWIKRIAEALIPDKAPEVENDALETDALEEE